ADPDNARAEYAVVVRSDWKRRGLGRALMRAIIDHARERGTGEIFGIILTENTPMIDLARALGFAITANPEDATTVVATLPLRTI
ncbi:MAG: GNAT family N-acetyltransferase, partial [Alphaproteobacteria bacterium]|nr:GNAT family N-acetyltransferase [Alphaproteobacteria bacterium]